MSADLDTEEVLPVDPDDEVLVAYLDGELSSRERDELEERLLEDESLRLKLQSLQSGWEMLDALPAPATNERLVESTLELVVSDIMKIIPEEQAAPKARLRFPLIVGAAALLAIAGGWLFGYQKRHFAERTQLRNLALAENLDAYLWGNDQTLMRTLQADPAWLNMVTTAKEMGEFNSSVSTVVQSAPVGSRFDVISELEESERATLQTRWDELSELDEAALSKVQQTADAVAAQPDAELLLKTMSHYAAWRSILPGEMRDAIETSEGVQRQRAIAAAVDFTLDSVSRRSGEILDEDTVMRIYHALDTFLSERMASDPALKESMDRNIKIFGDGARAFAIGRMINDESRSRGRGRMPVSPSSSPLPPITMGELDSIIAILSDKAIDDLNLLTNWSPYSGHDPRLLESTLRTWAEETVRRKFESLRPERGDWIDRYKELDEIERDELDLMEPDEIKRRLTGRARPPYGR